MKTALTSPAAQSPTPADLVRSAVASDRPGLFRLMECHLLHRAAWQYLGTRHEDGMLEWPIDAYHCDRCERSWERTG